MKIKLGIYQMEIADGDKKKNISSALSGIQKILDSYNDIDIICLPELFTTGYELSTVEKTAEEIPGNTTERIAEITKGRSIVIGSILERKNGKYYNTAFILGKDGSLIGKYSKIHLYSQMLEKYFLTPGQNIPVFQLNDLGGLKIGCAICYDIRFPEMFRMMALQGAQMIFVPAEFPDPKENIWKTLVHARAIENQVYMIGVNRVGKGKTDTFFGGSLISNGETMKQMQGNSALISDFEIDLDFLKELREKLPLLKDRRADLFDL